MDPTRAQIFALKGEVLRLANEVVSRDGGDIAHYIVPQADLDRESEPAQIQHLNMHIDGVLNKILSRPPRKRARSCETRGSAGQNPDNRRRAVPPRAEAGAPRAAAAATPCESAIEWLRRDTQATLPAAETDDTLEQYLRSIPRDDHEFVALVLWLRAQ